MPAVHPQAVKDAGEMLEEEMGEIREECFQFKDQLRCIFNYYSATGGAMRESGAQPAYHEVQACCAAPLPALP
jgi:hypothetical protein